MAESTHFINIFVNVIKGNSVKAIEDLKRRISSIKDTLKEAEKRTNDLRGALFGLGMSLLFGGWWIRNTFLKAFDSIYNAYTSIMEQNTLFMDKVMELTASWEYFKFTLMEALAQSELFNKFISILESISNWFSSLPPTMKKIIMYGIIFGIVLGQLMMWSGQLILLLMGIGYAVQTGLFTIGAKAVLGFLTKFALIGIAVWGVYQIFKDVFKSKIVAIIASVVAVIALMLMGVPISFIAGIALILGVAYKFRHTIAQIFKTVGYFIWAGIKWGINKVREGFIWLFKELAEGYNWLLEKLVPSIIRKKLHLRLIDVGAIERKLKSLKDETSNLFEKPKDELKDIGRIFREDLGLGSGNKLIKITPPYNQSLLPQGQQLPYNPYANQNVSQQPQTVNQYNINIGTVVGSGDETVDVLTDAIMKRLGNKEDITSKTLNLG